MFLTVKQFNWVITIFIIKLPRPAKSERMHSGREG